VNFQLLEGFAPRLLTGAPPLDPAGVLCPQTPCTAFSFPHPGYGPDLACDAKLDVDPIYRTRLDPTYKKFVSFRPDPTGRVLMPIWRAAETNYFFNHKLLNSCTFAICHFYQRAAVSRSWWRQRKFLYHVSCIIL